MTGNSLTDLVWCEKCGEMHPMPAGECYRPHNAKNARAPDDCFDTKTIEELEKIEAASVVWARKVGDLYRSLKHEGFSPGQSMELMKTQIGGIRR